MTYKQILSIEINPNSCGNLICNESEILNKCSKDGLLKNGSGVTWYIFSPNYFHFDPSPKDDNLNYCLSYTFSVSLCIYK